MRDNTNLPCGKQHAMRRKSSDRHFQKIWRPSIVSTTLQQSENVREIFRFSHRFWRDILVKVSDSDTQTLERKRSARKISRQNFTTRLAEKNGEKDHSALLQGSCSEALVRFLPFVVHLPSRPQKLPGIRPANPPAPYRAQKLRRP